MNTKSFIRKMYKKILRNVQDYGIAITVKKLLSYLFKPFGFLIVYRIYGIDLRTFDSPLASRNDFHFKIIDSNDSQMIRQIEEIEEWLHGLLKTKLENGGLCMVAVDGQKVAGFNLVAFGQVYIPLIHLKKSFQEDEAWSEQISVHMDYRDRRLASDLRYRIFAELKQRGIKRLYGGTRPDNQAAIKLAHKVGFTMLKDVTLIKILFFKTWRHKKYHDLA